MSVLRLGGGALLAVFLGWQTTVALIDLWREVTIDRMEDRRWAVVATEDERISMALGSWSEVYRAIEKHVPEESIVAFVFRPEMPAFGNFYQIRVLGYPRRLIPVIRSLDASEVAGAVRLSAASSVPIFFVVDGQSSFPVPPGLDRVAGGTEFTLWRVR